MTPRCHSCQRPLEKIDLAAGAAFTIGRAPILYSGVVCKSCKKVECNTCKGTPIDAPCKWCKGAVAPAYEHYF